MEPVERRTRSARPRRASALRQKRREARTRASAGALSVVDFQERLRRFDRELDQALAGAHSASRWSKPLAALGDVLGIARLRETLRAAAALRASERADDFGLDPAFEELVAPLFVFLYRRWWRVEVDGIENVPASGAAIVVANHSGVMFPYDGAMLKVALRVDHPSARELRPLVENFVFDLPFVASFMMRVGGVRACQENGERLLRSGEVVAVFPEGLRGMSKTFDKRYRLQRFGRGGFASLALRTGVPIVPTAVVGAEEIHPLLGKWQWPARLFGLPYLPVTPTFPWLGILGLLPLPTKWTIRFGEPLVAARGDGGDPLLVDRLGAAVRERIQDMIDEALQARRALFF